MAQNRRMTAGINGSASSTDPGVAFGGDIAAGVLAIHSRAVLVGTAGNIVGQLVEDSADHTYPVPTGLTPLAFKSVTSATAVGVFIL